MSYTTDRNNPELQEVGSNNQQKAYLVLSEEERAKGFVRPVRQKYVHVGAKNENPLRDLTDEETERYSKYGYVKFEEYPAGSSTLGRFWTEEQLQLGCGTVTVMGLALAETWAADIKFYGATFCSRCGKHYPVEEFVWDGTDERLGS